MKKNNYSKNCVFLGGKSLKKDPSLPENCFRIEKFEFKPKDETFPQSWLDSFLYLDETIVILKQLG